LANELFGTSDADLEVLLNADRMRAGYRGKGLNDPRRLDRRPVPDSLNLTAPTGTFGAGLDGGRGQLDVRVSVSDERVSARTSVERQPNLLRINPGNTDPAGYGGRP
jgi:hypothetical protein